MIGRLVVEGQDPIDDAGQPLSLHDLERHPVQDPRAELDPLGRRQDPLVRLDPDEHTVAFEELGREPVVVGDLRLFPVREIETGQRAPNPSLQVLGRLVREGEAQDVAGEDARVLGRKTAQSDEREIDHARRHDRCLPRTGAGHQDVGLEGPRDRAPLLLGGRSPTEHVEDLLRIRRGRAHRGVSTAIAGSPTSNRGRPSGKSGQRDWNSQKKQLAW